MPNVTLSAEECNALMAERDALRGELQVVKVERDLLQEKLKAYLRKLFAAKSEARGSDQADLFLNEAEALAGSDSTPAQQDEVAEGVTVAGHRRTKRGRRPLNRPCRGKSSAMNCPRPSATAPMTGRPWWRSASRPASSWTSFPSRCG